MSFTYNNEHLVTEKSLNFEMSLGLDQTQTRVYFLFKLVSSTFFLAHKFEQRGHRQRRSSQRRIDSIDFFQPPFHSSSLKAELQTRPDI